MTFLMHHSSFGRFLEITTRTEGNIENMSRYLRNNKEHACIEKGRNERLFFF